MDAREHPSFHACHKERNQKKRIRQDNWITTIYYPVYQYLLPKKIVVSTDVNI